MQGIFLSFEGVDGSGKSTQAGMLAEALRSEGREVVLTREPGGSAGAEEIRRLLVEGEPDRWSAETELLLFTAARRDHVEKTIAPALARGAVVITDRFADSTRVYQGQTGLRAMTDRLHGEIIGIEPSRTLVIDLPPEEALARSLARKGTETRFEAKGLAFQSALREGFLGLSRTDPVRVRVIDGRGGADDVASRVRTALTDLV